MLVCLRLRLSLTQRTRTHETVIKQLGAAFCQWHVRLEKLLELIRVRGNQWRPGSDGRGRAGDGEREDDIRRIVRVSGSRGIVRVG